MHIINENNKERDTESFLQLLCANQTRLAAFIQSLVPNRYDSADIMQETILVLWRKFDEFAPGTSFHAWANQVAYYQVLNYRRNKSRSNIMFCSKIFEEFVSHASELSESVDERIDVVQECMKKLSGTDREFIMKRYEGGLSPKKLSQLLNTSLSTIYRNISRIHDLLIKCARRSLVTGGDK